jgi:hypothetical protein
LYIFESDVSSILLGLLPGSWSVHYNRSIEMYGAGVVLVCIVVTKKSKTKTRDARSHSSSVGL